MALVRQLLLLPLLAPLLAVLVVGALNPRPAVALRLLIWTSPALPIGVWLMLAGAGGGALSAVGTGLALGSAPQRLQRQVRRAVERGSAPAAAAPRRREPDPAPPSPWSGGFGAGPTRPPGEASPTVAVAYRVIRKGRAEASPAASRERVASGDPTASGSPVASAVAVGDGWQTPTSEDW